MAEYPVSMVKRSYDATPVERREVGRAAAGSRRAERLSSVWSRGPIQASECSLMAGTAVAAVW